MTPIETDRILKRDVQRCNQHIEHIIYPVINLPEESYVVRLHDPDRDNLFIAKPLPPPGSADFLIAYLTERDNAGYDDDDDDDNRWDNIRAYLVYLRDLFTCQLEVSFVKDAIEQLSKLNGFVNAHLSGLIEQLIVRINAQLNRWDEEEHQTWRESIVHSFVPSLVRHDEPDFLRTFIEYLTGYFNRNLTTDHTEQLIRQLIQLSPCLVDFISPILRLLIVQDN
jgi:hypothetical protein